jgi:lambda repressor-like predicted transcriptional regulator
LVIAELNRIGVNLNQLTKTANSIGKIPPALDQLCRKIEAIVMKAVGKDGGA